MNEIIIFLDIAYLNTYSVIYLPDIQRLKAAHWNCTCPGVPSPPTLAVATSSAIVSQFFVLFGRRLILQCIHGRQEKSEFGTIFKSNKHFQHQRSIVCKSTRSISEKINSHSALGDCNFADESAICLAAVACTSIHIFVTQAR